MRYDQQLDISGNVYTLTIRPNRAEHSFEPVNTNGAQRGWRPIVCWLPHRVQNVKIISGEQFRPVITDDFILIPNPRTCDPGTRYEVAFSADLISTQP
ncbi:MAG: hypothetical protein R3C49_14560 [Planctomycetaceae bacterium]